MKRPKIADMTPIELARFRLLQCRRGTQRNLKILAAIEHSEELSLDDRKRVADNMKLFRSIIAITKPSVVNKAVPGDLRSMMGYIHAICGDGRRGLN